MEYRLLSPEEVARAADLPVAVVQFYASIGLIVPIAGYSEADLCELRRVRRLMDDLGLEHEAIEIILRMRQRMLALEQEVYQLRALLRARRSSRLHDSWLDADWDELC